MFFPKPFLTIFESSNLFLHFFFLYLAIHGAELLLLSSPPAARHVIDAAFDRQGRGRQLVSTSDPVVLSLYSYQVFFMFFISFCFSMFKSRQTEKYLKRFLFLFFIISISRDLYYIRSFKIIFPFVFYFLFFHVA